MITWPQPRGKGRSRLDLATSLVLFLPSQPLCLSRTLTENYSFVCWYYLADSAVIIEDGGVSKVGLLARSRWVYQDTLPRPKSPGHEASPIRHWVEQSCRPCLHWHYHRWIWVESILSIFWPGSICGLFFLSTRSQPELSSSCCTWEKATCCATLIWLSGVQKVSPWGLLPISYLSGLSLGLQFSPLEPFLESPLLFPDLSALIKDQGRGGPSEWGGLKSTVENINHCDSSGKTRGSWPSSLIS